MVIYKKRLSVSILVVLFLALSAKSHAYLCEEISSGTSNLSPLYGSRSHWIAEFNAFGNESDQNYAAVHKKIVPSIREPSEEGGVYLKCFYMNYLGQENLPERLRDILAYVGATLQTKYNVSLRSLEPSKKLD